MITVFEYKSKIEANNLNHAEDKFGDEAWGQHFVNRLKKIGSDISGNNIYVEKTISEDTDKIDYLKSCEKLGNGMIMTTEIHCVDYRQYEGSLLVQKELKKDGEKMKKQSISELQKEVHQNAVDHGWWEKVQDFGTLIALCHSELSEALEENRNGHDINELYISETGKLEGVPSELADVVIRVMDICEYYDIDLEATIIQKHEYNKSRSFKHGGKQF